MMILKTNNSSNIYGLLLCVNAMLKAVCNKYIGAIKGYHEQQLKLDKVQFYHNQLFYAQGENMSWFIWRSNHQELTCNGDLWSRWL